MEEGLFWWLRYLRIFALNSPFGMPVKFTIGVTAYQGERAAAILKIKPKDVMDAYGRPCLQVEIDDCLIAIEWLVPPPPLPPSENPLTWGGKSSADPDPRLRYRRATTPAGEERLKKPSS